MNIFGFFGSILGYLLWFLYTIFKNYGVAIILFTIVMKVVMFPASVKQQKSMAAQTKMAGKQKELQQKYGNNKQKYNEELMKLYEKEGVNPSGGCLISLIPFPIMLGIYYSVVWPLSNTLHIAKETVTLATDYISKIPGMVAANAGAGVSTAYSELEIIRNFSALRENLTMFTPEDIDKIEFFSDGFRFFGLDLLATPQSSDFFSFMWIIPALSLISSFGSQFYMSHVQKKSGQGSTQGCMKVMLYALPLMSVYWAYIMPGAVGFYWVISSITSFIQTLVTNKFFSADQVTAMAEARRAVSLELAEANVRPLPAAAQKAIADKIAAGSQQKQGKEAARQKGGQSAQAQKKKKGASADSSAYLGSKK